MEKLEPVDGSRAASFVLLREKATAAWLDLMTDSHYSTVRVSGKVN